MVEDANFLSKSVFLIGQHFAEGIVGNGIKGIDIILVIGILFVALAARNGI